MGLHKGVNATFDWLLSTGEEEEEERGDATIARMLANSTKATKVPPQPSQSPSSNANTRVASPSRAAAAAKVVDSNSSSPASKLTPVQPASVPHLAGYSSQVGSGAAQPASALAPDPVSTTSTSAAATVKYTSPTKNPGVAAAMAEAYQQMEAAGLESPHSMINELKRFVHRLHFIIVA